MPTAWAFSSTHELIAALLQCAELLAGSDEKGSRELVFGNKKKTGALQLIRPLRLETESDLPRLGSILSGWEERIATLGGVMLRRNYRKSSSTCFR